MYFRDTTLTVVALFGMLLGPTAGATAAEARLAATPRAAGDPDTDARADRPRARKRDTALPDAVAKTSSELAQERSPFAEPVRPITPELKQFVDTGYRRSHTFRSILDGLAGKFVIVHLVPAASLPSGLSGGLQFVTTANGYRYLRISMRTDLDPAVLIAVLGHELQHALEIGQARHVVDLGTLRHFYRLTGIESCLDSSQECYDTPLAQTMGRSVYAEVLHPSSSDIEEPTAFK